MTEAEWLAAADPAPMLDYLRGKISNRKLVLFAAACCRRIWRLLDDAPCRAAVEAAERFADGLANAKELSAVRTGTMASSAGPVGHAAWAAYWTAHPKPADTVENVHGAAAEAEARAA